jgi:hypothetical protein
VRRGRVNQHISPEKLRGGLWKPHVSCSLSSKMASHRPGPETLLLLCEGREPAPHLGPPEPGGRGATGRGTRRGRGREGATGQRQSETETQGERQPPQREGEGEREVKRRVRSWRKCLTLATCKHSVRNHFAPGPSLQKHSRKRGDRITCLAFRNNQWATSTSPGGSSPRP